MASVLDDLSLSRDFVSRFPDELAGGERQRVAIARALVVDPALLICDEVTSALDVSVQAVIVELLRRLQTERNLSMIFVTHNLALVRSIAQNVVVVAAGNVVESGPVEDVLERPADPHRPSDSGHPQAGGRKRMRIAVLGAGRGGHVHRGQLVNDGRVRELLVADTDPARAAALAAQSGAVAAAVDVDGALQPIPSAFIIAAPTPVHGELLKRCVAAGKPTLCESLWPRP